MSTSLDDTGAQPRPDDAPDTVVDLTQAEPRTEPAPGEGGTSDAEASDVQAADTEAALVAEEGADSSPDPDVAAETAETAEAAQTETEQDAYPRLHGWSRVTPWALMVFFLVPYLIASLTRYGRLLTQSPDLAIFEQAIQGYSKFKAPIVGVKGPGFNLLGDHFHPLLAVMGPFYRIWPSAVTILVLQSLLFALSIVPVTRVAMARLGTGAGVALGVAYGWSWGMQTAVDFDFHEICLAVPILAFSLEALINKRYYLAAGLSLLLLGVKEELTMTVAAVALVLFLRRQRVLGVVLAAVGFASFYLIVYKIIPHFNPDHVYAYKYAVEGGQHHKWWQLPIELVWPRQKLLTLAYTLGLTGFIALRSPIALIMLPTFAWRFHSEPNYWGTAWQYNAILMPALFIASIEVMERWRNSPHPRRKAYAWHVPALAVAVAIAVTPNFPFGRMFTNDFWHDEDHVAGARAAMKLVPDGAIVEANVGIHPPLVHRAQVYFPGEADILPDVIIIDSDWDNMTTPQAVQWAKDTYPEAEYAVRYADPRFTVLVMTDAGLFDEDESDDSGDSADSGDSTDSGDSADSGDSTDQG